MVSRSFAAALMVTTCTAAAGGSYLALRQNAAEAAPAPVVTEPASPLPAAPAEPVEVPRLAEPVAPEGAPVAAPKAMRPAVPRRRPSPSPIRQTPARTVAVEASAVPAAVVVEPNPAPISPSAGFERTSTPIATEAVAPPSEPTFFEIVVPSSAVIGLEVENTITSEQAQVEDRVDARVTRDVYADGRLAIPAGSRVIGAVTAVERGGKLKNRARLGVGFHTLVLAGGRQVPIRTEAIYREGDSPGAESSRKIGGAAIGGAVLGAILGGGKGAVTGASVGAAGGTAAVMAGGRNAATLAGGSVVTVRLSAPVTLEVER